MHQKIAVDVDDVLNDYMRGFLNYLQEFHGIDLSYNEVTTYTEIHTLVGVGEQEFHDRYLNGYGKTHHFNGLGPTVEAIIGVRGLPRVDKVIVTSRPIKTMEYLTKQWIDIEFPGVFSEVYFSERMFLGQGHTKAEICQEHNVYVLIDDSIEHASGAAEVGVHVILLDKPWNQLNGEPEHELVHRVKNWEEIARTSHELLTQL